MVSAYCMGDMSNESSAQQQFSGIDHPAGAAPGVRVTIVGAAVNVVLVVVKLIAGVLSGSQAIIADALHSASDLFTDLTTFLGLKMGRKAADSRHPYGHGRMETISAMVVGLVLVIVAVVIAYDAITTIHDGGEISRPGPLALIAAAGSILIKEWLYWYTRAVGHRLKSAVIVANAWHHRSDAFSSVAVLVGVGAVYLNPDWILADAYAALVVTFVVLHVGMKMVWVSLKELADTAPTSEVIERLITAASEVDGVRQIHDVRARLSGAQVLVEAHIVVDPNLSVREGHDIAAEVRRRMHLKVDDVAHVIIHVDPELKEG